MERKLTLANAFDLKTKAELIAFVGAGGKSSLMFSLARELSEPLVITTTTRMFEDQILSAAESLPGIICRYPDLAPLDDEAAVTKKYLIAGPPLGSKVTGVPLELPAQLLRRPDIDMVLVEADGAKMRPVKAPAGHEPAMPSGATLVVPVLGIDALGAEIQTVAHRPELVAGLLGKSVSARLTTEDLALLLAHRDGGLKNVPSGARVIPVLNKIQNVANLAGARDIAKLALAEPRIQQLALCQTHSDQPVIEIYKRVTAVVLAAGQSKRMGQLKQLLPWGETTILGQTISHAQKSAAHDCLVVTGYESESTAAIASAAGVPSLFNPGYAKGEMLSSLQTAVSHLSQNTAAVLVMLADQPMVGSQIIDRLLAAYWRGEGAIIAPQYRGRRGNPVIFDRCHFEELLSLPAGAAPRDLLKRHDVFLVPVQSAAVLQDIDNSNDYQHYVPGSS